LKIRILKVFITLISFFVISIFSCSFIYAQADTTATKVDTVTTTMEAAPILVVKEVKEINLSETAKMLCARWDLSEYRENGKVQELPNYELEFFSDGKYNALEEQDYDEGYWTMSDDNSKIIFDEGTEYREEWTVVSVDAMMFKVRFTSEGKKYEYTFVPYVEWKP
jgi:hypothetical protein